MEISILPIIVAVILNIVVSMVWYSPKIFGQQWASALKLEMGQKPTLREFVGAITVSLITVLAIAMLIQMTDVHTVEGAIKLAMLVWLGFIATNHFSAVLWAKKPLKAYFIEIGHLLIIILLNTLLLTFWK